MYKVLPAATIQKVQDLLAAGISMRKTARRIGVSRWTVEQVAKGLRTPEDSEEMPRPRQRCTNCGGLVTLPCHACHLRRLMAAARLPRCGSHQKTTPPTDTQEDPLTLQLRGECRTRYETIHAFKQREGEEKLYRPAD